MRCQWTLLMLCARCALATFTAVLQVPQGRIRGALDPLTGHHRFLGIPYAATQRFQPPRPSPKWEGVFTAVGPLSTCAQAFSYLILGSEDCLHLDVHTPGRPPGGRRAPVMVYFHGGAYYHGAKFHYDPEFLVTHDVVVVVVNYRLGVLGFLCIEGVSNLGIKDQIAALKWVKHNIQYFGGDPNNVTIFGQSAGASAVGMHLLTAASKGLFHKAILQSGSPLAPWAFTTTPALPATEDAKKLGTVQNVKDVYDIMKNASLFDLLVATKDTSINPKHFKYAPCVDGELFTDAPYNIIASGNYTAVPVMAGTTDNEGLLFYGIHDENTLQDLNDHFDEKVPSVLSQCSEEDTLTISATLRSHYFGNRTIDRNAMQGIINYYGDWLAYGTSGAFTALLARTSTRSVFGYLFTYEGGRNLGKFLFTPDTKLEGASHSDDVFYLFKPLGIRLVLTSADKLIIDRLAVMWTNFAKTGNPTPVRSKLLPVQWKPITSDSHRVLRIDRSLRMTSLPQPLRGMFFHDLLCEYGLSGYVPCDSSMKCHGATSG